MGGNVLQCLTEFLECGETENKPTQTYARNKKTGKGKLNWSEHKIDTYVSITFNIYTSRFLNKRFSQLLWQLSGGQIFVFTLLLIQSMNSDNGSIAWIFSL